MSASGDTRVFCTDCAEMSPRKSCKVVARGEWIGNDAVVNPPLDLPSHCVSFIALPGVADQRPGRERFPHAFAATGRVQTDPDDARRGLEAARRALRSGALPA